MERLCVVIDENSKEGREILHDGLAAYSITQNVEVILKWLKPAAREDEIRSACTEAQIAFVNASDAERATLVGKIFYQANPSSALVYYAFSIPQGKMALVDYFLRLFPARPVLYLDQPSSRECFQAVCQLHIGEITQRRFVWETKGMQFRIPYDNILYFRSDRNSVFIRLRNEEEYSFLGKLSSVENMLPPQLFLRAHQSYLVNRAAILMVDKQKKALRLTSGEEICFSKAHYSDALKI